MFILLDFVLGTEQQGLKEKSILKAHEQRCSHPYSEHTKLV